MKEKLGEREYEERVKGSMREKRMKKWKVNKSN